MRAKASVGSGDRRRRASSARPLFSDDFWRFGPDKGASIDFWPDNKGGWRGGGKSGRGRFCGARHAPRPPFLRKLSSSKAHASAYGRSSGGAHLSAYANGRPPGPGPLGPPGPGPAAES